MNELARRLPVLGTRAARSFSGALNLGVELRLWVATCVAGLTLFASTALGLAEGLASGELASDGPLNSPTGLAVLVSFFATLALYNLDGTLDSPKVSPASAPLRRRLHLGLTVLSFLVLVGLVFQLSVKASWLVLLGALLCGLYAMPLPLRGASTRLKSLPYLKGPFVGTAVATAVVWVPLWANAQSTHPSALLLTAVLALYCTANAVLFDIPDIAEDAHKSVPTLPAKLGLTQTKQFCALLSGAGALLALATQAPLPLFTLGIALLVASWRIQGSATKRSVAWWVDGALLLPLFLAWALG